MHSSEPASDTASACLLPWRFVRTGAALFCNCADLFHRLFRWHRGQGRLYAEYGVPKDLLTLPDGFQLWSAYTRYLNIGVSDVIR